MIEKSIIWWNALSEKDKQSVMFKGGYDSLHTEFISVNEIKELFFMEITSTPEMRKSKIDYFKVRNIDGVCLKGISCNLCDFIDREQGKLNSCIIKYYEKYHSKK
jgi:hypothetical protein